MPIGNLIVVSAIVATFLIFMLVLGAVAWWSQQTPQPKRVHVKAAAAHRTGASQDVAGLKAG